jgi:anti-anti-sigma regulatory factor
MAFIVKFAGSQTIREAEDVSRILRDALSIHSFVVLDCDEVEEADLTFLQLLIAGWRSAQRDGKQFGLTATARGPLLAALDRAGIHPEGEHLFWFEGASAA